MTDPVFNLDEFLPYRLNVLANLLSRSLASIYQDRFGLSIPEWRIMATLGMESPLSAGEVGQRTRMEKPRVSRALNRMLEAGLISRQPDPRDNRIAVLKLSRRGLDLYRRITPLAQDWQEELLAELSAQDRRRLTELLDHLQRRLQGMDSPSECPCPNAPE